MADSDSDDEGGHFGDSMVVGGLRRAVAGLSDVGGVTSIVMSDEAENKILADFEERTRADFSQAPSEVDDDDDDEDGDDERSPMLDKTKSKKKGMWSRRDPTLTLSAEKAIHATESQIDADVRRAERAEMAERAAAAAATSSSSMRSKSSYRSATGYSGRAGHEEQFLDFASAPAETPPRKRTRADSNILCDDATLLRATVLVEDALTSRKPEHLMDVDSINFYRKYNRKATKWVIRCFVFIFLGLGFFEAPAHVPLYPEAMVGVEFLCLAVFMLQMVAKWRFLRPGRLLSDRKNVVQMVIIVLTLIDVTIWIVVRIISGDSIIRWSRPFRPWFLVFTHKSIRLALRDIRKTVRDIADVLLLVLIVLVFYTIVCVILFPPDTAEGQRYFYNPGIAFVNLYALLTTVNFPDVMMPAYSESPWWCLVFISFLLIGLFFLMNLVLAVVYNNYRLHFKNEVKRITIRQRALFGSAFRLLDRQHAGSIGPAQFAHFFVSLQPDADPARVALLFTMLDEGDRGRIDALAFCRLPDLLDVRFFSSKAVASNMFDWLAPRFYRSAAVSRLRRAVLSDRFAYFIDGVIVLNGVFILVDFYVRQLHLSQGPTALTALLAVEVSLTLVFVIEAMLKVFSLGPRGYWDVSWNRFDAMIILASTVSLVLSQTLPPDLLSPEVTRLVLLLRVLRLTRLVYQVPRFRVIFRAMGSLSPVMLTYLTVMLVLYYSFAMVGMEVWGGMIYRGNPLLVGTDFARDNYFANNFNSLPESLVLLFELTVVNNWHILAHGFVAVSSPWAYLYFLLFHVFSSIMIMNIVVAFILEVFQLQFDLDRLRKEKGDPIQERLAQLVASSQVQCNWRSERKPIRGYGIISSVFRDEIQHELEQEHLEPALGGGRSMENVYEFGSNRSEAGDHHQGEEEEEQVEERLSDELVGEPPKTPPATPPPATVVISPSSQDSFRIQSKNSISMK